MMKKTLVVTIALFAIANICFAKEPSFQGLGDLPGGIYQSEAYGISDDGTVIVGQSVGAYGREAFKWTQSNGIQGLGGMMTPSGIESLGACPSKARNRNIFPLFLFSLAPFDENGTNKFVPHAFFVKFTC